SDLQHRPAAPAGLVLFFRFSRVNPLTPAPGIHRINCAKAGLSMKRVCDLLADKGRGVWSLAPEDTVYEAIDQMAQKGCGALLVMEGTQLVGIVSERDYARKVILKGKSSRETEVREIMSFPVVCISPDLT